MQCGRCGASNREGRRFCAACGAPLVVECSACGFSNEPDERFCGGCGAVLIAGGAPRDQTSPRTAEKPPPPERRQLTVMFCDLVGSTALSAQVDPEELREVVCAYQDVCGEVVRRFHGHIAQYLGDGLLVYFGYPLAHEDDAQRAVRAGLAILQAVERLSARLDAEKSIRLAVRVGIHTGPVVLGQIGDRDRSEQLALGETPNLAARLQEQAEPGGLVISVVTHRLVHGLFTCRDLGESPLKGVPRSTRLYQVLGETTSQGLDEHGLHAVTQLVGREQEVGLLLERWERVKVGQGQVVLLSGEAGIGKSRLVRQMRDRLTSEPHAWLTCRCSAYHQDSAFYPVIRLLERALELDQPEAEEKRLAKLEAALEPFSPTFPDALPLFAALLSMPLPDRCPSLTLTPAQQKQRTLETVLHVLLAVAAQRPVFLTVEDLQWTDPSTLELLGIIVEQAATARILTLFTFRPDFRAPWASRAHFTHLMLNRLTARQTELLVERLTGRKALPAEVRAQIVARTDGIPLFIEELTKTVLESGWLREEDDRYVPAGPLPALAIPTTLQDSLMARLDRLGTAKEVAQIGSVIGREFSHELLHAVAPLEEPLIRQGLERLVEAELLHQRGLPPAAGYVFKHALIQEAAYQTLLKKQRLFYHERVARALEEKFPEKRETEPELVAQHYSQAGLKEPAISYWQKAGRRAVQRSAHLEAIGHVTKGLEMIRLLPETSARARQELALQIALAVSLMATRGYAAVDLEEIYVRARELCYQVRDDSRLFPVLMGSLAFHLVRGEHTKARSLGEELLDRAQASQDPARLLDGHYTLAHVMFFLGELALARDLVEKGIGLYEPGRPHVLPPGAGQDPMVSCLSYASVTLWMLGYPGQALSRSHEALALARRLEHPFTLAYALGVAAMLHQYRGELEPVREQAKSLVLLSSEHAFAFHLGWGTILDGWTLVKEGRVTPGIAQMRAGLATFRSTGAEVLVPYWLALIAEACGHAGDAEEGLSLVTQALTMAQKNEEWIHGASLYRLKGELLAGAGANQRTESEAYFRRAIEIARGQGAKSLELRARTSLARLWQQAGRRTEARQLVAEIHGWFTEGFDTADLKQSSALLEALA